MQVVLSGEGADEVHGGYLYFHKAPSPAEFHKETVRKTTRLHQWDVCRANKSTFAFGLEARVPFLDKDFLELSMNLDPKEKMIDMTQKADGTRQRMEKYLLRKAFDGQGDPYLPSEVLWRQKEQFSDGVGYDWVDGLKDYANRVISVRLFCTRNQCASVPRMSLHHSSKSAGGEPAVCAAWGHVTRRCCEQRLLGRCCRGKASSARMHPRINISAGGQAGANDPIMPVVRSHARSPVQ